MQQIVCSKESQKQNARSWKWTGHHRGSLRLVLACWLHCKIFKLLEIAVVLWSSTAGVRCGTYAQWFFLPSDLAELQFVVAAAYITKVFHIGHQH
jgi:hypothetical protein